MKIKGYDILPCPFCGSEDLHIIGEYGEHEDNYTEWKWIACQNINCSAEGPSDLGLSGAIDKWNTRIHLGIQISHG